MTKIINKKNNNVFLLLLLVGIYPVLPEYFGIGKTPFYMFIPLIGLLLLLSKKSTLIVKRSFIKNNSLFFLLCTLPFIFHSQLGTWINWFVTTVVVLYLLDSLLCSRRDIEWCLDAILYVSIIINLIALIERFTGYNVWSLFQTGANISNDSSAYFRYGVIRIEASFGVALTYSMYLLFVSLIALYKIISTKSTESGLLVRKKTAIYVFAFLLSIVCIVFTQCRLPLITIVFSLIFVVFKGKFLKKSKVLLLVLLILLVVGVIFIDQLIELVGHFFSLFQDFFGGLSGNTADDLTTAYRFELIPTLLPYIEEKPVFGYGASYINNGFTFIILDHKHKSIDNNYLAQALYYGIVGLLGNVWWIFSIIKRNISLTIKRIELDDFEFFILLICIVYAVNLFSLYQMMESHLFYIIVGLYCKYEDLVRKER